MIYEKGAEPRKRESSDGLVCELAVILRPNRNVQRHQ